MYERKRSGHGARRRRAGFSLIELMVVITIIGLLAGLVGVNVYSALKTANIKMTKGRMSQLESAIKRFWLDKKRNPEELSELVPDYLESEENLKDSWGFEIEYVREGRRDFTLVSYGADGEEGGEDEDADIDREALRRTGPEEDEE